MPKTLTLEIDFNAPVTLIDVQAALFAFFRWWADQLLELVPGYWKQALQNLMAVPVLDVRHPCWKLSLVGADALIEAPDAALDEDALRQQIHALFPEGVSSSIEVILSPDMAMQRRILVPFMAVKHLRSVVQLQLDRLSPFRGDDVVFDCRLAEPTDTTAAELAVDVAIIPKTTLQGLEQRIRQIGLVPRRFRIGETGMVVKAGGVPWTRQRQTQALFLAAACVIWAAAFGIAPIMRKQETASLQAEISSLAPELARAEELRQELGRYELPGEALSTDRARALDVLLVLTKALPDQVHVTSLTIADNTLMLRGTAPSNMAARALLIRTGLFEQAHITGSQNGGHFRFKMALRPWPAPREAP